MPYKTLKDLPDWLHDTPKHLQEIFQTAFNAAFEQYKDEEKAFAAANDAVKKKYEKNKEDKWVAKSEHAEFFEGKWVPVFKTGTHTDSEGRTKTWTEADLDKIINSYDPKNEEAPAVIGHPKSNSPAYGWVENLKKEGNFLYAKFKQLVPEFVNMVERGLFKRRSISIRDDGSLRHVGWLGAMPPAIKGLPNIQFDSNEGRTIEFSEIEFCEHSNLISRIFQRLRDWLIEKEGGETADKIINNFELEMLRQEAASSEPVKSFLEDKDMKIFDWLKGKAKEEGVVIEEAFQANYSEEDAKKKAEALIKRREAEFAEAYEEKENKLREREKVLREMEAKAKKQEIASFCEGLLKGGKLIPAMMKKGLPEFLENLSGIQTTIEFGEGRDAKKQSLYKFAQEFLSELPKAIEYKEIANAGNDISGKGNAGARLDELTKKKMKEDKIGYVQAFSEIREENPDLVREYALELNS